MSAKKIPTFFSSFRKSSIFLSSGFLLLMAFVAAYKVQQQQLFQSSATRENNSYQMLSEPYQDDFEPTITPVLDVVTPFPS